MGHLLNLLIPRAILAWVVQQPPHFLIFLAQPLMNIILKAHTYQSAMNLDRTSQLIAESSSQGFSCKTGKEVKPSESKGVSFGLTSNSKERSTLAFLRSFQVASSDSQVKSVNIESLANRLEDMMDTCGNDHITKTQLFETAVNIGTELHRKGEYRTAVTFFKHALYLKNKTLAEEPIYVQKLFADVLFDIGVIHSRSNAYDQAKALQTFQLCIDLRKAIFGSDHPSVAVTCYSMAAVYFSLGDLENAQDLLHEALAILLFKCRNQQHLKNVWIALSEVQKALGDEAEAKSSLVEAAML